MRYKAGDKVKIRKDLEVDEYYGNMFLPYKMAIFKGEIVTIEEVFNGFYHIEEESEKYGWTDEMIEGLWEECKSSEQVSKSEGKYKLIDILNKIANGELKEDYRTEIKMNGLYYRLFACQTADELLTDLFIHLNDEVELIEPDHFTDVGKMAKHLREDTKIIEPTDNTKIEELVEDNYQGEPIQKIIADMFDKLNEVIREFNKIRNIDK